MTIALLFLPLLLLNMFAINRIMWQTKKTKPWPQIQTEKKHRGAPIVIVLVIGVHVIAIHLPFTCVHYFYDNSAHVTVLH